MNDFWLFAAFACGLVIGWPLGRLLGLWLFTKWIEPAMNDPSSQFQLRNITINSNLGLDWILQVIRKRLESLDPSELESVQITFKAMPSKSTSEYDEHGKYIGSPNEQ